MDETDKKASECKQISPQSPLEKFDFGVLTTDPFESVSTERGKLFYLMNFIVMLRTCI